MGPNPPKLLTAVVEIPRGGRSKFEYDVELGIFRLDRVLYSAVHYPAAYGFIPGTRAGDGDAADVLVLTAAELFPGCVLTVRPVGLFRMRDDKGDDEKVLAVADADPNYAQVHSLGHVPSHLLREIEHFFRIYKELEDKKTGVEGWQDRAAAERVVAEAMRRSREPGG